MKPYTKFTLCGLNITYNSPTYYTINGTTVIMQDETIERLLVLDTAGFVFRSFAEFVGWLKLH